MTGPEDPGAQGERRTNRTLRELLDELIGLVRHLARHSANMSQVELDYTQQRMEWLANEIYAAAANPGQDFSLGQ